MDARMCNDMSNNVKHNYIDNNNRCHSLDCEGLSQTSPCVRFFSGLGVKN